MWVRCQDDTIVDLTGRVVYFSLERFVRDICLGECCFICGVSAADALFNDEHVLPRWLLRRYDLFALTVTLPNGTSLRYDRYTVPCCEACNTLMGRVIEEPVRALVEGGYDAIEVHKERNGIPDSTSGWV